MDYSIKGLQQFFGADKIRPDGDYLITTHTEAGVKVGLKTHKVVGEVPDSSLNEDSTMVVLERIPPVAVVEPQAIPTRKAYKPKQGRSDGSPAEPAAPPRSR